MSRVWGLQFMVQGIGLGVYRGKQSPRHEVVVLKEPHIVDSGALPGKPLALEPPCCFWLLGYPGSRGREGT